MVIDKGNQEVAEVSDDRSSHTVMGNPFDNRFRFDITQLFQRKFL